MHRRIKKSLRTAVRAFWGTLLFGIITLAVLVQLGRAIFPVLDDYRSVVEDNLSERMQVDIDIGSINAKWEGLRPQLRLFDVEVNNRTGDPIFLVNEVDLEIGLLSTLRDWRLALRTLTFRGLSATVDQHQSGRWYVRGLETLADVPERDNFTINDPLDIFLFGRRVEMLHTEVVFNFRSGLQSEIAIPSIRLENDANFHRLAAEFAIDRGEQALSLVVEGRGNPRLPAEFDAEGYLSLTSFPSEKVLAAFGIASDVLLADEADTDAPANWRDTGQVDLQLWFDGTSAKGINWRGDLAVSGVPVIPPPGMRWPESLHSDFSGRWHPESGWFVDLAGADLRWPEFDAPPLNARIRGKLGEPSRLQIAKLDIGVWRQVLARAGLLPKQVATVLDGLAPAGELQNVMLSRKSAEEGYFLVQANLRQAAVSAWKGVPAVEGVDGFVEASAFNGHMIVASEDGFTLDFPQIYNQPLQLQQARGDVRWQMDTAQRLLAISSGTLRVSNEDIAAVGHVNLRLPFTPRPGVEPELTLVVGIREGAVKLHRLLVPYTVPQSLYTWLNESIQGGVVKNAGFIFHGSLRKNTELAQVLQLSAKVAEGELVFAPDWPALSNASATVVLDNDDLQVSNLQAQMMGVRIAEAEVSLERLPDGQGRAIGLDGKIAGESGAALSLLQNSPLVDMIGEQLASWQVSGGFSGQMSLLVPLEAEAAGARQRVTLNFTDNELYIPQLELRFSELSGPFTYSDAEGVASENISARLWGQAVQGRLTSQWQGDEKQVQLDFAGQLDAERLQQWSARPELGFVSGVTAISGRLKVPVVSNAPLELTANSLLQGVEIDLPEPFAKSAEDTRLLEVDITAHPQTQERAARLHYDLRLAEQARLAIHSRAGKLQGIGLALGEAPLAVEPGLFNIYGSLPLVDLRAWKQTLDQYLAGAAAPDAEEGEGSDDDGGLPVRVTLALDRVQAGPVAFDSVSLAGGQEGSDWLFDIHSAGIVGSVRINEEQPLELQLSYLYIPTTGGEISAADDTETGLAAFDLDSVAPIDFYCDELIIGERALGRWRFKLRPVNGGLIAYDLEADTMGTEVGAVDAITKGAELVWLRSVAGDLSYVSARVTTGDVGKLLTNFGQEKALTSDRAAFDVRLQWAGAPDEIGLNKLLGVIDVELQRGRFIRGAEVGENPVVKLLGLLNFDTLARRLRLDFSDLNPEGLGYERVRGRLAFKEGIIEVNQPLQVDSPASHIQFVGDIDMLQQTLDAQLVTTFPLTGNLTMAAALTGVLPAAVGVFVVGKLFKEQIDRVSSIRYKIDGSWHQPKVEVQKVFENQTDQKAGK